MGVFIIPPLPSFLLESLQTAGPLRSTAITPFHRSYEPIRHPLAFLPFPGVAGYRSDLLQRFLPGTRRASPVAECALAIVLSLSPRQSGSPLRSVCDAPCCLHPAPRSSALGRDFSRLLCVYWSLRPDDLLTILKMALSIARDSVSLFPAIQATRF